MIYRQPAFGGVRAPSSCIRPPEDKRALPAGAAMSRSSEPLGLPIQQNSELAGSASSFSRKVKYA